MRDNSVSFIYDKPVPYKELTIYPVKMIDFYNFSWAVQCLTIDKDSVPDPKVISMNYYEFLFYISDQIDNTSDKPNLKLDFLLRICLNLDRDSEISPIEYGNEGKRAAFRINGVVYYSKDFDEIKNIILNQNSVETFNPNINKETRDLLDKARSLKAQLTGDKLCGLEDQMICLSISTGLSLDKIYEMTLRKFKKYVRRIDHKIHYEIYKTASMSGFVEFKDKNALKHWMADLDKEDNYEDVLVSFDSVSDKINNKTK